ncbi:MAG: Type I transmembrane sorting receptor [Phylliscum demangeonii]|nr:MAG: Type I transmembrane sorting receptor [Phylliscum demangeonii]
MKLVGQIIWASAVFASLTSAGPIQKRSAFTVHQSRNAAFKGKNGPAALAGAFLKFGIEVPQSLAAASGGNDGTATATPQPLDTEYLVPVTIGNGQTLNLDLDTGSADLRLIRCRLLKEHASWVFSSSLSTQQSQGHQVYNPAQSSTFQRLPGYTWNITYADGSGASGTVGTDTVNMGGTVVSKQAVELANRVSAQFAQQGSDGLIGMAFSSINTVKPQQQLTFFDNAKSSLVAPLFTADLKPGVPGAYDFGFIDSKRYKGPIAYSPVDSRQGFWAFSSSGYQIGSGTFKTKSLPGIADTGTTLLIIEDGIAQQYYASVPGAQNDPNQGGYTFPCSAKLPNFTFGIGSYRAVISGSLINFAPVDSTGTTCFGGIQPRGTLPFNIFGDIMFKAQFVVFDAGNNRVGFAAKA